MSQQLIMWAHRAGLEPGRRAQRLGPVSPPRPGRPNVRRVLAPQGRQQCADGAARPTSEQNQNCAPTPVNNDQKVVATIKPWSFH